MKLLVVGLVRDSEKTIAKEVSRISGIMSNFYESVDFHVIESDSIDNTLLILNELSSTLTNFTFESLGTLQEKIPNRISRLRYCRNRYVQEYREKCKKLSENYSEILVVDFDIRNVSLTESGVSTALNIKEEWAALFANQRGRYFDIYALRHESWSPNDCLSEVTMLENKGLSREKAKDLAIWKKMHKIKVNQSPIEVKSAFGGFGMYKSWVFDQFNYTLDDTPIADYESEHVALHYKIRQAGGKLFIVPSLTNFAWNPHNLASFKVARLLDKMSKKLFPKPIRSGVRSRLG